MSILRSAALRIAAHPVLAFWVFFALFPFIVPNRTMATQVLIFGLLAMGFNLLYGYTGLLSFGHAAYYGLGAYGCGIALAKLHVGSLWLGLASGLLLAGVGGAIIGFFCLRRQIFDYMKEGEELVVEPFRRLIGERRLWAHKYYGYWAAMDTFKDKISFDRMEARGNSPWMVWKR